MRPTSLVMVLLLTGCSTSISGKSYDQTCAIDSDCVVVFEGDFCGGCGPISSATAINVVDAARFQRDRDALSKAGCPPRLGPAQPCAPPEAQPPVEAVARCMLRQCVAVSK
ncbi:MAG: hypothetical protein JNM69_42475 [Archangium sp.]|nr:hypothetical protein [Archangium sp.]